MFVVVLSLPSLGWSRTEEEGLDPASDEAWSRGYREPTGDALEVMHWPRSCNQWPRSARRCARTADGFGLGPRMLAAGPA